MIEPVSFGWLHDAVSWLLMPSLAALLLACAIAVIEAGIAAGERFHGLRRLRAGGNVAQVQAIARHRLERADLLARIPPMLGLMATIIPLGPGLAALGAGDPAQLASAVTVAFDATVLGLVAGIGGLVIGKLRRRWYEETLEAMEDAMEGAMAEQTVGTREEKLEVRA
ncbi:MAG TPA: MotA/TolQ/ExbB proton channel family protein [Pseudoduganella sp.]|jgi:biopolymer transport protein ExbB/TolQ